MHATTSSHHWLSRFSIRFIELRGDVPWQRVVARAVVAYGHGPDRDPEDAAVAAVRALPPRAVPAPYPAAGHW